MKTRILTAVAVAFMALTGCTGTRVATAGGEVDDVYYNREDRRADQAASARSRALAEAAIADEPEASDEQDDPRSASGSYDQGLAAKNGETEGAYDRDPYADDDYYYSRQVRRFNSNSWNYYDPFYSYDPYYAIGTPTWSYYNNSPWWYDPYFYNGPSYAWTSGWGQPGYSFYPSQYFFNQPWYGNGWSIGYGSYSNWGYGGYGYGGGFGGYGNYYGGGFGGSNFGNGWCGAPGYYGGGTNFGFGSSTASNTTVGPRNNPSSLNTSGRPGNQPVLNPRSVRPYQGNYPVVTTPSRPVGNMNPKSDMKSDPNNIVTGRGSQGVDRPVYNQPNGNATQPSRNDEYSSPRDNGYSRPSGNESNNTPRYINGTSRPTTNGTYSAPRNDNGTSRPATNGNYSAPRNDNGSSRPANDSYSRPRNDTYSTPSRSYESAPSRPAPTFSSPSPSNGGGSSRPSNSSGGSSRPR